MAYKITEWEYSGEVDKTAIPVEEGLRYLKIMDASFDPSNKQYEMSVQDLTNSAEFTLRYWLNGTDKDGNIVANTSARGTLISLGKALFGMPVGIPAPGDVVGGVVTADVVLKKSATSEAKFPRVFKFSPATKSVVDDYSDIEQYSE